MSALESLLFPTPTLRRRPAAILRWWEARRLTYNVAVGSAGLVTLAAFQLVARLPMRAFPWPVVVAYGLMANVCYSFGWIAESLLQRWLRRETYGLGPALWRHGLVFSVGLTLLPIGVLALGGMLRLLALVAGH